MKTANIIGLGINIGYGLWLDKVNLCMDHNIHIRIGWMQGINSGYCFERKQLVKLCSSWADLFN